MCAFLCLYKPGSGREREASEDVFIGDAHMNHSPKPSNTNVDAERLVAKEKTDYNVNDPDTPEAITLVSLGNHVDGGIRRLHGGVTATLLDQVLGTLISNVYQHSCATTDLSMKYRQAVTTPCVLLFRAKLVREKGRWIETRGWVEDGKGIIFAECAGAFVMNKVCGVKI
jgi:acyl-coenzyme A thioesterase PaaI-like protein